MLEGGGGTRIQRDSIEALVPLRGYLKDYVQLDLSVGIP